MKVPNWYIFGDFFPYCLSKIHQNWYILVQFTSVKIYTREEYESRKIILLNLRVVVSSSILVLGRTLEGSPFMSRDHRSCRYITAGQITGLIVWIHRVYTERCRHVDNPAQGFNGGKMRKTGGL